MLTATLGALLGTMMGCDSEPADDEDDDAAASDVDEDDGDEEDDDATPPPKDPDGRTKSVDQAPADPDTECDEDVVDEAEDCDDEHWPAADVELTPLDAN